VIVLHTETRAADKLAAFTSSSEPWIVAVNMVSEGVDIPRLRVGVYATAAKTPLIFRQIVGRFVRTIRGRAPEPSWLYLPADPLLRRHASEVESELRHLLRRPESEEGFEEEREPRRASERSEAMDFVPLSAEVAPQMTLFGSSPAMAAAQATAHGAGQAAGHSAGQTTGGPETAGVQRVQSPGPPPMAAFERRDHLRAERSRLVADLHRRDKRSHREINAWVNREVGIVRVDKATIEQLERSVALLVRELTRRSRGAAVRA
jgi:hypothetical protein